MSKAEAFLFLNPQLTREEYLSLLDIPVDTKDPLESSPNSAPNYKEGNEGDIVTQRGTFRIQPPDQLSQMNGATLSHNAISQKVNHSTCLEPIHNLPPKAVDQACTFCVPVTIRLGTLDDLNLLHKKFQIPAPHIIMTQVEQQSSLPPLKKSKLDSSLPDSLNTLRTPPRKFKLQSSTEQTITAFKNSTFFTRLEAERFPSTAHHYGATIVEGEKELRIEKLEGKNSEYYWLQCTAHALLALKQDDPTLKDVLNWLSAQSNVDLTGETFLSKVRDKLPTNKTVFKTYRANLGSELHISFADTIKANIITKTRSS